MSIKTITGFHAIEEYLRSIGDASGIELFYSAAGPRIKKIIAQAEKSGVTCNKVPESKLNELVAGMPEALREHRGIVLVTEARGAAENEERVSFDEFISLL